MHLFLALISQPIKPHKHAPRAGRNHAHGFCAEPCWPSVPGHPIMQPKPDEYYSHSGRWSLPKRITDILFWCPRSHTKHSFIIAATINKYLHRHVFKRKSFYSSYFFPLVYTHLIIWSNFSQTYFKLPSDLLLVSFKYSMFVRFFF